MLFSTKAEYGVRLMVELGRQPGSAPVSLGVIAEAEQLPLSYLEHLVARLRNAGLVRSTRGAHGGYRLAQPAETITLDQVVEGDRLRRLGEPVAAVGAAGRADQSGVAQPGDQVLEVGERQLLRLCDDAQGDGGRAGLAAQLDHQAHSVLGFG